MIIKLKLQENTRAYCMAALGRDPLDATVDEIINVILRCYGEYDDDFILNAALTNFPLGSMERREIEQIYEYAWSFDFNLEISSQESLKEFVSVLKGKPPGKRLMKKLGIRE